MSERRWEWTDPETGAICWLDSKKLEMDTRGEIGNVMGVIAHYAHHLAATADTLERTENRLRLQIKCQERLLTWCADCRDKVADRECQRCRAQRAESRADTLERERDEALHNYETALDSIEYDQATVRRLTAELAQAKADTASLRAFAQSVMQSWPEGGDIDGCDLQDKAEKHGLLRPETRTEPCGENCWCEEYDDFPQTCYRKTALLTGEGE